jgi:hypothetical protein
MRIIYLQALAGPLNASSGQSIITINQDTPSLAAHSTITRNHCFEVLPRILQNCVIEGSGLQPHGRDAN